nr:hypothetical protein [Tanacetum cinerariifolium]GEW36757.1 hypothetical protein [Tanacetum cinerariifolium]
MRTRNSYFPNNSSVTISRRQNKRRTPNVVEPELRTIVEVAPMADNRTMEELLQAPTEGFGEVIVISKINADHFEIKMNLLQLVQANPYHGFERENPNTHINNFKRITSTLKFRDVPNDENASKTDDRIDKLSDQISTLINIFAKKAVTSAPVKAVEESYVTCGGAHTYYNCPTPIAINQVFVWRREKLCLPKVTPTRMTLELADRSITHPKGVAEDVFFKVGKFYFSTDFVVVDFEADPRVPLILGRSFLRTGRALIDVYGEEITPRVNDEAVTFNLNQTTRYSSTYDDLSGSDFILEEIEAYLKDESISLEIDHADCDPEGDICLIEKLLNDGPFQLPSIDLKQGEEVKAKSSIEKTPELELKDLPSHLQHAYLEGAEKLPVIIAKDLKVDEKVALLKVLKSHKRAIAWKIIDIKGIDPRFCTHKILMEEDY